MAYRSNNTSLRTLLSHVAGLTGAGLLLMPMTAPSASASSQSITEQAQNLESDAKRDYPTQTYTDSVRQEGLKKAEAVNNNQEKNDEEKIQNAIGNFFGFYFVNTRNHVSYCARAGVDISPFTHAFVAANKNMYEQSSKLLYRRGVTEEQLFKQLQPALDSMTAKNFADLAANEKLSITQECQLQTQNIEARVARVTFAKILPNVSKP